MDKIASLSQPDDRPPCGAESASDDGRIEQIGRYTLHARIGSGGMAAVHLGWLTGAADFSRVVAIKRLHPQFALDEQFASRFRDEAWLCSRLSHANVVQVLDVVEKRQELLIVMEYVHGVSVGSVLADAARLNRKLPPAVVTGILVPALHGLHAAHEATDEDGQPIGLVHRDFSPQNIMVTSEGHVKVLDFGIAKAKTHAHVTTMGQVAGKSGYFAPEQATGDLLDRRTDVFAAGIVLWEMLTGRRLFGASNDSEAAAIHQVLHRDIEPPSSVNALVPGKLDEIVLRALQRDPDRRFATARDLAHELEASSGTAGLSAVAEQIADISGHRLAALAYKLETSRRLIRRTQPALDADAAGGDATTKLTVKPPESTGQQRAPRPAARRPLGRAVAIAGVALVLLGLGLALGGHWPNRAPMLPSATVAPTPPGKARETPAVLPPTDKTEAISELAEPAQTGHPPTEPSAQPTAARPRLVGAKPRPPVATRPRKTEAARSARPNCDPPTYLAPDGIRIYKDECL